MSFPLQPIPVPVRRKNSLSDRFSQTRRKASRAKPCAMDSMIATKPVSHLKGEKVIRSDPRSLLAPTTAAWVTKDEHWGRKVEGGGEKNIREN